MTGAKYRYRRVIACLAAITVMCAAFSMISTTAPRAETAAQLQSKLDALEKEEKTLKSQLASYKSDAAKQQQYSDSLLKKIDNSKAQIEVLQEQIDVYNAQIAQKDAAINGRAEEIAQKQKTIDDQLELLGKRLQIVSKTGNLSALQMIFDTENYIDYLLKQNIVERVAASDQKMIDELNAQIEILNGENELLQSDKAAIEEERRGVEELKAVADSKKKELDTLYAESNAVLKKLQASVNNTNASLAAKKKQAADLENQIQKILNQNKNTNSGNYTGGIMAWPVPAVHNISSGYGARWGTTHYGIDIANGSVPVYGQSVVAAADGTVIYANTSGWGGGYGLYVMIDHGKDAKGRKIVTLYAHMSKVLVSVGQKVKAGSTVVGKAGSSGDVTGPHLHFEVRVDGKAVDPIANGYVKVR